MELFLNVTTLDGELLDRIDLRGYDLSKPLAVTSLVSQLQIAASLATSRKAKGGAA